jgi:hypothetical protein
LQRAKYYFALVELDSSATAAAVYERVDGMEWEHSSTTVDLSFVALGETFEGRQPRDVALASPAEYDAPQFVTKAKQQSKVTCTWDEDDPGRARSLGRLQRLGVQNDHDDAAVRDVLALSSDDDDDAEAGSSAEESDAASGRRRGGGGQGHSSAAAMRKMMGLGGDSDSDSDEEDAFFTEAGDDGDDGGGNSYFIEPSAKEDSLCAALAAKKGANGPLAEETPWAKTQRKLAEKKAAHKAARKARLTSGGRAAEAAAVDDESSDDDGKVRNATDAEFFVQDGEDDEDDKDDDADEDARNYDMRAIERHDKMAGKKLKGARARKEAKRAAAAGLGGSSGGRGGDGSQASFQVDVSDPRFAALLDGGGDGRYGLDPTSASFKATKGMDAVLKEQRRRRLAASDAREQADLHQGTAGTDPAGSHSSSSASPSGSRDLSSLVSALKRRAPPSSGTQAKKNKGGSKKRS